jgi:hypothetical protein
MIVDLPNITTNDINKKIVNLHEEGGPVTMGRVMTLAIAANTGALLEESIPGGRKTEPSHEGEDMRGANQTTP